MPGAALLTTTLTTPVVRPYRLFLSGEDVLNGTPIAPGGVPFDSLEWDVTSTVNQGTFSCSHWDPSGTQTIRAAAEVRLWNAATDEDEWGGYLIARETSPAFASGRIVRLRAVDWSIRLDKTVVTATTFAAGLSDRAIIQGLFARFPIAGFTVSGTYIDATNTNMPEMKFELQSLRSALDMVAKAADSDGLGERFLYVDPQRRVRYFRAPFTTAAPYDVTDGVPAGGQINVSDLDIVYDDSQIITCVQVKGANAAGSGWVPDLGALFQYGPRTAILDVPDSDTQTKRNNYAAAYLRTVKDPIRRGSFTKVGTTGWKPDQTVNVTSASFGLTAEPFDIKRVTATFVSGLGTYRHEIEIGALKPGKIGRRGGSIGDHAPGFGPSIGRTPPVVGGM